MAKFVEEVEAEAHKIATEAATEAKALESAVVNEAHKIFTQDVPHVEAAVKDIPIEATKIGDEIVDDAKKIEPLVVKVAVSDIEAAKSELLKLTAVRAELSKIESELANKVPAGLQEANRFVEAKVREIVARLRAIL